MHPRIIILQSKTLQIRASSILAHLGTRLSNRNDVLEPFQSYMRGSGGRQMRGVPRSTPTYLPPLLIVRTYGNYDLNRARFRPNDRSWPSTMTQMPSSMWSFPISDLVKDKTNTSKEYPASSILTVRRTREPHTSPTLPHLVCHHETHNLYGVMISPKGIANTKNTRVPHGTHTMRPPRAHISCATFRHLLWPVFTRTGFTPSHTISS
ncbi:hypothetical protein L210DRAFT_2503389 [Boletus edulis BED1]|uniref:Uncharacterized protein n=1 Tax=Boletus edulis BED1 TaxID=1328754 RepID=A0AAD4BPD5_BOLED|nr:hypothetical protein L210DRAFT_2503389 [Boletus edulis BED1]